MVLPVFIRVSALHFSTNACVYTLWKFTGVVLTVEAPEHTVQMQYARRKAAKITRSLKTRGISNL